MIAIILAGFGGCEQKDGLNSSTILPDEEYITQARYISTALPGFTFEQSETVPIDSLITYFCIYELRDEKGNYKDCYNDCEKRDSNIIIPKERVNNRLMELFDIIIDDTDSVWSDTENTDCYNIYAMTRGGNDVPKISDENLTIENGLATLNCKVEFSTVDVEEYEKSNTVSINDETVCVTIKMRATENGEVKILSVTKQ